MEDDTITVPELAIEGVLPRYGLVLLGGRPKEGKSWLACQLALSFVTGGALGGWLQVLHPGRCHLWALEDQYPITKDKMLKLLQGLHPDRLCDLRVFAELAQPILRGGDQIIRAALDEHPAELIILDSLFKLTGHDSRNQDVSQRDYDVIDRVRKIALNYKCVAVIIMHTRKGARGGNPIENLLGTTGNTAAADVVCELSRTGYNGKLTVVGRGVNAEDYGMVWHAGEQWGWTIEGTGDSGSIGETQRDVLAYLQAQGAVKPGSIALGIHKPFGSVGRHYSGFNHAEKFSAGRTANGRLHPSGRLYGCVRDCSDCTGLYFSIQGVQYTVHSPLKNPPLLGRSSKGPEPGSLGSPCWVPGSAQVVSFALWHQLWKALLPLPCILC